MRHAHTPNLPLFPKYAGAFDALNVNGVKRSSAIASATDHAERESPGWKAQALAFLVRFAGGRESFIAEDCIAASKGVVPEASDARAWGGIFQTASRRGLIHKVGYAARELNGSPTARWAKGDKACG